MNSVLIKDEYVKMFVVAYYETDMLYQSIVSSK